MKRLIISISMLAAITAPLISVSSAGAAPVSSGAVKGYPYYAAVGRLHSAGQPGKCLRWSSLSANARVTLAKCSVTDKHQYFFALREQPRSKYISYIGPLNPKLAPSAASASYWVIGSDSGVRVMSSAKPQARWSMTWLASHGYWKLTLRYGSQKVLAATSKTSVGWKPLRNSAGQLWRTVKWCKVTKTTQVCPVLKG